jgi:hypothetical protein
VNFTNLGVRWRTIQPHEDRFDIVMNYADSPRVSSSGIKIWDDNGNEVNLVGSKSINGIVMGCNVMDFAAEVFKTANYDGYDYYTSFRAYTISSDGVHQGGLVPGKVYRWVGYVYLAGNNWYYETPMQFFTFSTVGSRFGSATATAPTQTPTPTPIPTPTPPPAPTPAQPSTPTLVSEMHKYKDLPVVVSDNGDFGIPVYQYMKINTQMNGAMLNSLPMFDRPSTLSCHFIMDVPHNASVFVFAVTVEKIRSQYWALIDYKGQFGLVSANWIEDSHAPHAPVDPPTMQSSATAQQDCTNAEGIFIVTIPANFRLDCFASPTTTSRETFISEKSAPYIITATRRIVLPNGTTRYFFRSGDNPPKDLYFEFTNAMNVEVRSISCS